MNPSALRRWAVSMVLRRFASDKHVRKRRAKVERARARRGQPHVVEYFHQVDDGYSHLAAQLLRPLLDTYDVQLVCHLVPAPSGDAAPEPDLLMALSRYDSAKIAPHYGLSFPADAGPPGADRIDLAQRILAGVHNEAFPDVVPLVGKALMSPSLDAMVDLA